MDLRVALLPMLAIACCPIGYGQDQPYYVEPYATSYAAPYVTPVTPLQLSSYQAGEPNVAPAPTPENDAQLPPAAPTVPDALPPTPQVASPIESHMEAMPAEPCPADAASEDCDCSPGPCNCVPGWRRLFALSYWKRKGLPSPWCSPGNMSGHIPSSSCAETYYYFRPYSALSIPEQQQEAAIYGLDPRNPYDNRKVFDGLYDGLE